MCSRDSHLLPLLPGLLPVAHLVCFYLPHQTVAGPRAATITFYYSLFLCPLSVPSPMPHMFIDTDYMITLKHSLFNQDLFYKSLLILRI